jgi:glycosyltransferase-like protein
MTRPLRIAILAHSTSPRGGVVHALELGDALTRLGHDTVVHAPDPKGTGFFRPTLCRTVAVPACPVAGDVAEMVRQRVAGYIRYFESDASRFDVFHAQDSISGNALATLKSCGGIDMFARTVHHVDTFEDPCLTELQARAIGSADRLFVVSRTWQKQLAAQFGLSAEIVGNGVDTTRYSAEPAARDAALRHRLGFGDGPVFLSIGGVEERKNTVRILAAFQPIHQNHPAAQLVIAGGASLLDHHAYQQQFGHVLAAANLPAGAVILTGPLPQDDMPSLYRLADALVFPSVKEGFGLVVLEAMASGLPVVTSDISPFTEYLGPDDVAWCDPFDVASIASAMKAVLGPMRRQDLINRGRHIAARHDWQTTARAHLDVYAGMKELRHA